MQTDSALPGAAPPAPVYYPWFDWLRAVCAGAVMLYHDHVLTWSQSGNFGVQVFFALSGWLIGTMLLDTTRAQLPRFYFNRAVRIWAPYYLALTAFLAFSALREPVTARWIEYSVYMATFVFNLFGLPQVPGHVHEMPQHGTLDHVWTVNAEEQFYLIAPLLLVVAARAGGRSIVLWAALAVLAWISDVYAAIVLGVLAALLARRYGAWHLKPAARVALAACVALCVAVLAAGGDYARVAPVAAVAIVLLAAVPGRQHRFGELFGGMSYPLYLNHWVGVFAMNYLMPAQRDSWLRHTASALVSVAVAMALYRLVDRPLLAHRSRWYTPARARIVMAVAYAMVGVGVTVGVLLMPRH